jgi:hypothetical protein
MKKNQASRPLKCEPLYCCPNQQLGIYFKNITEMPFLITLMLNKIYQNSHILYVNVHLPVDVLSD